MNSPSQFMWTLSFGEENGYALEIKLSCLNCTFTAERFSCARQGGSSDVTAHFDVNRAMVIAFTEIGQYMK